MNLTEPDRTSALMTASEKVLQEYLISCAEGAMRINEITIFDTIAKIELFSRPTKLMVVLAGSEFPDEKVIRSAIRQIDIAGTNFLKTLTEFEQSCNTLH